ncbi:MAG: hypothetical protein ACYCZC_06445 [Acidithiobacillus sp.]
MSAKTSWWPWAAAASILYIAIWIGNGRIAVDAQTIWLRAGEYALWTALALGAIARRWPAMTPYGWRPLAILSGAVLSGLEIFLRAGPLDNKARIDAWMTALIGIAIVAILARVIPAALRRSWFGQEGKTNGSDSRTPR